VGKWCYLGTGVKKQAANGGEDDSNGKEQRQHRLGCQNGSIVSVSADVLFITRLGIMEAHTAMPSNAAV
jgi:hypothetical protein